jgi:hypothetical protein
MNITKEYFDNILTVHLERSYVPPLYDAQLFLLKYIPGLGLSPI